MFLLGAFALRFDTLNRVRARPVDPSASFRRSHSASATLVASGCGGESVLVCLRMIRYEGRRLVPLSVVKKKTLRRCVGTAMLTLYLFCIFGRSSRTIPSVGFLWTSAVGGFVPRWLVRIIRNFNLMFSDRTFSSCMDSARKKVASISLSSKFDRSAGVADE